MSDRIISGTHPDVWILTEPQHVIVCHYPNIPDFQGKFGSSSFFFDYEKAIDDVRNDLRRFVNSGNYKLNSNQVTPDTIYPNQYAPMHKWVLIYLAWTQYLQNRKTRPLLNLFDPFYYDFLKNGVYQDDSRRELFLRMPMMGAGHEAQVNKWNGMDSMEQMNLVHPISYFPPMEYTTLLDDIIFYKPGDGPNKIIATYSASMSIPMYNYLVSRGKTVRYSDIIKSNGYGFTIDFNITGINIVYTIPSFRDIYSLQGLKDFGHNYGSYRNRILNGITYKVYEIAGDFWPVPTLANTQLLRRDAWIQYWLMGGPIPSNPSSIVSRPYHDQPHINNCLHLDTVYPYHIQRIQPDIATIFEDIFKFASIIIGVAVSAYTGNYASLANMGLDIVTNIIKTIYPDISKYVDMAVLLIVTPILQKSLPEQKKKDDSTNLLLSMASSGLKQATAQELNDLGYNIGHLVDMIDTNLTERQKSILATISYQLDSDATTIADIVSSTGNSNTVQNAINNKKDAVTTSKNGSEYLLAGGIIGAALLLKKFWK